MNFLNSSLSFGKSYYDYKAKKNANDVNDERLTTILTNGNKRPKSRV